MRKLLMSGVAFLFTISFLLIGSMNPVFASGGNSSVTKSGIKTPHTTPISLKTNTVGSSSMHAAYNSNDPYDSGCASGAYVAGVEYIKAGNTTLATVENWYSPTCVTNWGQIEWPSGSSLSISIMTASATLTPENCYPTSCSGLYSGGLSPSWTDMVDGHNQVCVTGKAKYRGTIYQPLDGNRGVTIDNQDYICE